MVVLVDLPLNSHDQTLLSTSAAVTVLVLEGNEQPFLQVMYSISITAASDKIMMRHVTAHHSTCLFLTSVLLTALG